MAVLVEQFKPEIDTLRRVARRCRQLLQVAGDDGAVAFGQHVKERALPRGAFDHLLIKPPHTAFRVGALKRGVFLVRERIGIAQQLADRGEIDVGQHADDEQQNDPGLHDGKPERRRTQQQIEAPPHPSRR